MYYQTALHECKLLIEIKLNLFSVFNFLYKDDTIFNQSTYQHRNELEFKIIAVLFFKQVVNIANIFFLLRNVILRFHEF